METIARKGTKALLKGKDEAVAIFEPLVPTVDVSQEESKELILHRQALKLYRAQNWDWVFTHTSK